MAMTMMQPKNLSESRSEATNQRDLCLVTETYPPEVNGVAQTMAHLMDGLRLQGYSVSLVRPRQHSFDGSDYRYQPGATLVRSLPLPGYRGLHIGVPASAALRRCWTERRPDVIYVATQGPLGRSAVSTARQLGIPVFSGFHTNFDAYSNHYHAGWLRFLIWRYLSGFHNRTAGTLVPCAELRGRLQAMGLRNIGVFGRGVDAELFTPRRRNLALRRAWCAAPDDLVALYVGRLAPEKNLNLAIESYRAMQRVNATVKFVLVGDGPLRAALQKKHPDLIFCGMRTGERLAEHYASADVFLFPSETETFGNVTLEALASGLAVVAYDYAAARLHIKNGTNGILVPYGEALAFVDAAAKLARAPQALADMRQQARQHAGSLDWQLVVKRFAAFLLGDPARIPGASSDRKAESIETIPAYYRRGLTLP